ncbi:MAG: 1,4-dihydroxy-2-naphthoate octaprenyltransferase, partial [Muribaculaceae bacterium]|nr:1,4-dihydroxy-2-naphthoate octaprenyltransferase [Muribaculaceae bacterium]
SEAPRLWPAVLCVLFALLAQIASNFANEYYDYKGGLDRVGRDGPRRGVTEGDISPRSMFAATVLTLGLACLFGCALIIWGGFWLVAVGVFVALGVLAYSTGPWPLSHHGMGEVAVVLFFGIIPVNFTYWLVSGHRPDSEVAMLSLAVGLMAANVLVVNNLRDRADDEAVGKRTLAVLYGERFMLWLYLWNGIAATALMWPWRPWWPLLYLAVHLVISWRVASVRGRALNPMLGITAVWMFVFVLVAGLA